MITSLKADGQIETIDLSRKQIVFSAKEEMLPGAAFIGMHAIGDSYTEVLFPQNRPR